MPSETVGRHWSGMPDIHYPMDVPQSLLRRPIRSSPVKPPSRNVAKLTHSQFAPNAALHREHREVLSPMSAANGWRYVHLVWTSSIDCVEECVAPPGGPR